MKPGDAGSRLNTTVCRKDNSGGGANVSFCKEAGIRGWQQSQVSVSLEKSTEHGARAGSQQGQVACDRQVWRAVSETITAGEWWAITYRERPLLPLWASTVLVFIDSDLTSLANCLHLSVGGVSANELTSTCLLSQWKVVSVLKELVSGRDVMQVLLRLLFETVKQSS